MRTLILSRFGFIVAIFAMIVALFRPNFKPRLLSLIAKHLFNSTDESYDEEFPPPIYDHPKLSGRTFKRKEVDSGTLSHKSWYNLFSSSIQSEKDPSASSWFSNQAPSSSKPIVIPSHNDASTSLFFILTATLMILVIYVLVSKSRNISRGRYQIDEHKGRGQPAGQRGYRSDFDEVSSRKWSPLSREEKTKRLLMRHGGSQVSDAIKFLVAELEKQKLLMIESLSTSIDASTISRVIDSDHDGGQMIPNGDADFPEGKS